MNQKVLNMTPFAHFSNDELISLAYNNPTATPLEMEFAFRLEHGYADDVKVTPDLGITGLEDLVVAGALRGANT
jgi:hypothetical protein